MAWLMRGLEREMLKGQFQRVLDRGTWIDMWEGSHTVEIFTSHHNAQQRSSTMEEEINTLINKTELAS